MFPIKPHEDRIIVRLIPNPEKSAGGLHIPDTARGVPSMGVVAAIGPGKSCEHCGLPKSTKLELGWTVVFPEGAGYPFDWDDVPYKTIRFTDIWQYEPTKGEELESVPA